MKQMVVTKLNAEGGRIQSCERRSAGGIGAVCVEVQDPNEPLGGETDTYTTVIVNEDGLHLLTHSNVDDAFIAERKLTWDEVLP